MTLGLPLDLTWYKLLTDWGSLIGGGFAFIAGVIAYQIYLKASDMDITDSYNDQNPTTTPLNKVSLVE